MLEPDRSFGSSSLSMIGVRRGPRRRQLTGILKNPEDGELTIQDRQGRFIDSDTVSPGNDPVPPRDKQ